VDSAGNAYVTGSTASANFPTTASAYDRTWRGSSTAFVAKLTPDGSTLAYSTFLGGSGGDAAAGIAVDSAGNAYVTGSTASANFPSTPGGYQPVYGGNTDGFLTKLSPDGTALVYSTLLGGGGEDHANAVAVDSSGNAYVTGSTSSADFPTTPDAFSRSLNGISDAFVAKVNATGTGLLFSTVGGGSNSDRGNAIGVDSAGSVYLAGETASSDFPTSPGAVQPTLPAGSFVAKIAHLGQTLLSVSVGGGGTVTSNPLGIGCPADCAMAYVSGTSVTLSAVPANGWRFDSWGGDCTGTDVCVVSMTTDRSVTATFARQNFTLTVTKASGDGTITSDPPGITCGANCSAAYPFETQVTLNVTPSTGFVFAGWQGDCTGTTPTCTVAMTQARNVTATFARPSPSLTVSKFGNGNGFVDAFIPPGVFRQCNLPCSLLALDYGTSVTLTLSSITGSFTGWSGEGCSGAGSCTVTMTQDRNVTAVFAGGLPTLALALNQSSFQTGGNLSLTATTAPGASTIVDVYVALALPGGALLYLQGNGSLTSAGLPLVSHWTPVSFSGQIFQYHFTGAEPPGQYTWYAAFVGPGGNPLLGTLGPIVAAPFTFSP
jgi:uncharacterized repeat protein (TIGR02543 family)